EPGRLLDRHPVLDDLVIDATESGLGDGFLRDLFDSIEAHPADGGDALRPRLDFGFLPDFERPPGSGDGLIEVVEYARRRAAHVSRTSPFANGKPAARAVRARAFLRQTAQLLDDLLDQLVDLIRWQHDNPLLDVRLAPLELDRVDDRHDGRVDRTILRHPRLPRGGTAGVENDFAEARAHRVDGDHQRPGRLSFHVGAADEEQLEPAQLLLLVGGDDRPDHAPEQHRYFFCVLPPPSSRRASPVRPSGRARSMLACGRGITCTLTSWPMRSPPRAPASGAAFTAATS